MTPFQVQVINNNNCRSPCVITARRSPSPVAVFISSYRLNFMSMEWSVGEVSEVSVKTQHSKTFSPSNFQEVWILSDTLTPCPTPSFIQPEFSL